MDADDEQGAWLARVGAGDRGEPLVALYRAWGGRMHALGMRSLGDHGQAEELVQETFVRLWQSAHRFDPAKGTARAFAFTIAHRTAVDLHRRAAARPRLVEALADDASAVAVTIGEAPDAMEAVDRELLVQEAVASLSAKHREVLEMSFERDLPDARIAEALGVPLGTVRSRTYYALRALRGELEERGLVG